MTWLRDWWRGWSDTDLESVLEKIEHRQHRPGEMVPVTEREMRAHIAWCREKYPLQFIPTR